MRRTGYVEVRFGFVKWVERRGKREGREKKCILECFALLESLSTASPASQKTVAQLRQTDSLASRISISIE